MREMRPCAEQGRGEGRDWNDWRDWGDWNDWSMGYHKPAYPPTGSSHFHPGDRVEVIILERTPESEQDKRYPLRGKPIRYEQPTEPVAIEDWEAMK